MNTKEKIMELLEEVSDDNLLSLTRESNSYDGSFDYADTYESIEDLVEIMDDKKEIARAIIYGNVENMVDPVRFNGYGNIETISEYELVKECQSDIDEIAEWIVDNGTSNIYTLVDEVEEVLNEQEEDMEV